MHDGNRGGKSPNLAAFGYLAALLLCCVVVGVLTYGLGSEDQRRDDAPASYAKAAKADAERACLGREGPAAFECIYEKVESAQEQARGEQDLSAQQRAANSALFSAIVSLATLILSGVGVWFVKRTLDATLEAVEDTGRATIAMEEANRITAEGLRPWVVIEKVEFLNIKRGRMLRGDVEGPIFFVNAEINIRNIGSRPTTHYQLDMKVLDQGIEAHTEYRSAETVDVVVVDGLAPNELKKESVEIWCDATPTLKIGIAVRYKAGDASPTRETRQLWEVGAPWDFADQPAPFKIDEMVVGEIYAVQANLRRTIKIT